MSNTAQSNKGFAKVKISSNNPTILNDIKRQIYRTYPTSRPYRVTVTYLVKNQSKQLNIYLNVNQPLEAV